MIVVKGLSKSLVDQIFDIIGISPYMDEERKRKLIQKFQREIGVTPDGIIGEQTLYVMGIDFAMDRINQSTHPSKFDHSKIREYILDNKWEWYDSGDYRLNIVGIRSEAGNGNVTNWFDDFITVTYRVDGDIIYKEWQATTDPGLRPVKNPSNPNGVARLVPGQWKNCYALGLHKQQYEALRQVGMVSVYRDNDRDIQYDSEKIQTGLFGINIHKAGANSTFVDNWSEGCQVFKRSSDFDDFMKLVKKSVSLGTKRFTYTLIEEKEL